MLEQISIPDIDTMQPFTGCYSYCNVTSNNVKYGINYCEWGFRRYSDVMSDIELVIPVQDNNIPIRSIELIANGCTIDRIQDYRQMYVTNWLNNVSVEFRDGNLIFPISFCSLFPGIPIRSLVFTDVQLKVYFDENYNHNNNVSMYATEVSCIANFNDYHKTVAMLSHDRELFNIKSQPGTNIIKFKFEIFVPVLYILGLSKDSCKSVSIKQNNIIYPCYLQDTPHNSELIIITLSKEFDKKNMLWNKYINTNIPCYLMIDTTCTDSKNVCIGCLSFQILKYGSGMVSCWSPNPTLKN